MPSSTREKPIFITTIPKAGKNLLQSFLFHLRISRYDYDHSETQKINVAAATRTHMQYFPGRSIYLTYGIPDFINKNSSNDTEGSYWNIVNLIEKMPEKSFILNHYAYDDILYNILRTNNIPVVFLYRDPGDIVLSMANYIFNIKKPDHLSEVFSGLSIFDVLLLLFEGNSKMPSFFEYIDIFHGWLEANEVLSLRFEDLVGPLGCGRIDAQFNCFKRLVKYSGWKVEDDIFQSAIFNAFSALTSTFAKGEIGGWKKRIPAKLYFSFKDKLENARTKYGYQAYDINSICNDEYQELCRYFAALLINRENKFREEKDALLKKIK